MSKTYLVSFFGFLLVLITTVVIILYADGYSYDFFLQKVEKTGVLKINSTPESANIVLNNTKSGTTPLSLFNLTPKAYNIQLTKNGYLPWEDKVILKGGDVNAMYPVLYPKTLKASQFEAEAHIDKTYFGSQIYAFTTKSDTDTLIFVHFFSNNFLDIGEETRQILALSTLKLDSSYQLANITFSASDSKLLLTLTSNKLPTKYFLLNLDNQTAPVDLDTIINTGLYSSITWGTDDNSLILYSNSLLLSLDTSNDQKIVIYQTGANEKITNFSMTDQLFLFSLESSSKAYQLYSIRSDGTDRQLLGVYTNNISSIITTDISYAYTVDTQGAYTFYKKNKASAVIPHFIPSPNNNIVLEYYSPDGNYLLYKDVKGNYSTYSFEAKSVYPLNLASKSVISIIWDKNSQILFYTLPNSKNLSHYDIHAVGSDGSNNVLLYEGAITDPIVFISPNTSSILFLMMPQAANTSLQDVKSIYQLTIDGI